MKGEFNEFKSNPSLIKDKLLLLRMGHEPFTYTAISALNIGGSLFGIVKQMASLRASNAKYKMNISDLKQSPILYVNIPLLRDRKRDLNEMIDDNLFRVEKSFDGLVETGKQNHNKLLPHLKKESLVREMLILNMMYK